MQDETQSDSPRIRSANVLTVEALRLSSPHHITPTRTLRLSEAEAIRRESPSLRVLTTEALSSRPRSNPRTRTPRRYESPLNPGEFRRESLETQQEIPRGDVAGVF